MEFERAAQLLKSSKALLEGHFLLSSGSHSGQYVQCALLLSQPDVAVEFMKDIAEHFKGERIHAVLAPAIGGIIVAYEVARLLGIRALFMEREEGMMRLRRGFSLPKGERILIVEDVITTGGTVVEVGQAVEENGGKVVAFASIVDRSGERFQPAVPYYSCATMNIAIYEPKNCPLCRDGIPLVKPGSRSFV